MKKSLFLSVFFLAAISLVAQKMDFNHRAQIKSPLKNVCLKSLKVQKEYNYSGVLAPSVVKIANNIAFAEIGTTQYDLQTNASTDHRIYYYRNDNTIGATWTKGSGGYADRGTGYNYFDGTTWGAEPTARIETVRTGWGSYSSLGTNEEGEIVVAHNGTNLTMNTRATKGTGAWTQTTISGPAGTSPTWPRVCTNGNNVYILAEEYKSTGTSGVPYNGQRNAMLFFRSTDGGQTFDINGVQIPQIDGTQYPQGLGGGDAYSWAQPKNGTLAFVAGDDMTDIVLMKSTDNGATWTKKIVFQHPYPNWTDSTLTPDTPYTSDGSLAVALDNNGKAHVVFGRMRVLCDTATLGSGYSWFPMTDGLIYWNEDMPTLTENDLKDENTLNANGNLIAWTLDLDSSGVLFDNLTNINQIPVYYKSLTSMPQITIDENNWIFVTYKMTMENMMNANTNPANEYYNHVWARACVNGVWTDSIKDMTGAVDFNYAECVYPAMAQYTSSGQFYFYLMEDGEPGLSGIGNGYDGDPESDNYMLAFAADKSDLLPVKLNSGVVGASFKVYPNPASDYIHVSTASINGKITSVKIMNMLGAVVKTVNMNSLESNIDISDLANGLYMVELNTTHGNFTKKIVKN